MNIDIAAKKQVIVKKVSKILNLKKPLNQEQEDFFLEAFVHKSITNEIKNLKNNEYLEFLGDAILQYVASDIIFKKFRKMEVGQATRLRSKIVDTDALFKITQELNLSSLYIVGKGSFVNGMSNKIFADLFEAFIGATYMSFGLDFTYEYLNSIFNKLINSVDFAITLKDPKSVFQEVMQSSNIGNLIVYKDKKINEKEFFSQVCVGETVYGSGSGTSKKIAQKNAALDALKKNEYRYWN
ncbi:ribonuclease III [Mycoplasma struthionis]|uniref:Ribonuclease 3 n=1 Tax=Mycoplasma struthionis TaxID=538220 RepID=A0A502M291_9MOLU|nr:ribonuclease III [Mycoplasma struthionis]TPI02366.1 ribonuclease III [Mycoplasma struthionis]